MSDEKLTWAFELMDRVSNPLKKMSAAFAAFKKSMGSGGLQDVFNRLPQFAQRGVAGVMSAFNLLRSKGGAALKSVGGDLLGLAGGIVGGLASFGLAAGGAAIGFGALGAKAALDAYQFRENTLTAFKTILGSQEAAQNLFAKAQVFADKTTLASNEVIDGFKQLLTAGFKGDQIENVFRTVADVAAGHGTEGVTSVIRALGQIQSKGRLQAEELMQLAEGGGIGQKAVFESLAKTRGVSTDQIQKLLSDGRIKADEGVAAVLDAIVNTVSGGKAGSLQEELSKGLTGKLSNFWDLPTKLFNAADTNRAFDALKGLLDSVTDALSPTSPGGARIVALFDDQRRSREAPLRPRRLRRDLRHHREDPRRRRASCEAHDGRRRRLLLEPRQGPRPARGAHGKDAARAARAAHARLHFLRRDDGLVHVE